jgi:hypothetical protein
MRSECRVAMGIDSLGSAALLERGHSSGMLDGSRGRDDAVHSRNSEGEVRVRGAA